MESVSAMLKVSFGSISPGLAGTGHHSVQRWHRGDGDSNCCLNSQCRQKWNQKHKAAAESFLLTSFLIQCYLQISALWDHFLRLECQSDSGSVHTNQPWEGFALGSLKCFASGLLCIYYIKPLILLIWTLSTEITFGEGEGWTFNNHCALGRGEDVNRPLDHSRRWLLQY